MAYLTGTAASCADLLTALRSACTANGWTLAGNVLHKGGCYADITVGRLGDTAAGLPATSRLQLRVGNGIDGSNALTDPAPINVGLGVLRSSAGTDYPDWDWPVTYHIHVLSSPDEVFLFVNYNAQEFWQYLSFGKAPAPGNVGTSNYQCASLCRPYDADGTGVYIPFDRCAVSITGASTYSNSTIGGFTPVPFSMKEIGNLNSRKYNSSQIHGAIDEATGLPAWSRADYGWGTANNTEANIIAQSPQVNSSFAIDPLLGYASNAWNQETVLLPLHILGRRQERKSSLVGEIKHLRMCRNDYIAPGGVITLGPDRWKVYPAYRRDLVARNPSDVGTSSGARQSHSGTIAMAIRYDGP